jgi:hypothetical protein
MDISHKILSLNSTPQNAVTRGNGHSMNTLNIQNISSSGNAYLGDPSVTTTNFGYKIYPGQSFSIEMAWSNNIYVVGDSGVQVAIIEAHRS